VTQYNLLKFLKLGNPCNLFTKKCIKIEDPGKRNSSTEILPRKIIISRKNCLNEKKPTSTPR
jgi:hypothetical protein